MNLQCPHCGEQIVVRRLGKCPSCFKKLPEELQLTQREKELDELVEDLDRKRKGIFDGDTGSGVRQDSPIY